MPTAPILPSDVALVTVTYGDRLGSLLPMIDSLVHQGVRRVTAVCNGVPAHVAAALQGFEEGATLEIVDMGFNQGSAPGYARGLRSAFSNPATKAAFLVDDDNLPAPDCLEKLLNALTPDQAGAVCALRTDIPYIVEVARHGNAEAMRLPAGQIFNYDLRTFPRRLHRKLLPRRDPTESGSPGVKAEIPIPRAPYSGILVPRSAYEKIGGPVEAFVLYGDDLEFSERLAALEGGLRLVPDAHLSDAETSWDNLPERQRPTLRLATAERGFRLFYAVRNAVFLDVRRHGFNIWLIPNSAFFLLCVTMMSLVKGRPLNALVVARAFFDGVIGRLGLNRRYPLPNLTGGLS